MTIPLTGTGGLFTRLGKLGGRLNELNAYRGTTTLGPGVDAIAAQYESTNQNLINGLYQARDSYRGVHSSFTNYLKNLAQQTLISMANDDAPLSALDVRTALKRLISQMTGVATVQRSSVGSSVTPGGSNVGDPKVIVSTLGTNGLPLELAFPETLVATITADAQSGGATAGREPVSVKGVVAQSDLLNWDYPLGSGASASLNLVDAQVSQGTNLLYNSGFDLFTVTNQPDNWVVGTGSVGTSVLNGSSGSAYRGNGCLRIVGDGSELTSLTQTFSQTSGGTTTSLKPSTVYAVCARVKVSAVPSGGVLELALVNGSGTIIQDTQAADNKVQVTLSGQTTSYAAATGFFRTPAVLPSSIKFRVRLSTALDSGKSVYVDELALTPATSLYTGGPYLAAFRGATDVAVDDYWSLAITNTYGQFQQLCDKFFGTRALGLLLPSAVSSPTISEGLIS